MYISGTQYNLEDRIHQLCITSGDFAQYSGEYLLYSGSYSPYVMEKVRRELVKRNITLSYEFHD